MKRMYVLLLSVALLAAGVGLAQAQTCEVNSTLDTNTAGTLRYCIGQANSGLASTITFNIITAGGGPAEIVAESEYLITANNLLINGYSQPGSLANTNDPPLPLNTRLGVSVSVANNGGANPGYAVFRIEASGVTIRGLNIHSGPVYDVAICVTSNSCQGNNIQGNFIGTDITGTLPRPSGWRNWNSPYGAGVYLGAQAQQNYIGINPFAQNSAHRNLISGESPPSATQGFFGFGVFLDGTGGTPNNNFIIGNLIGTNASLTGALGNNWGVAIFNGVSSSFVAGNVIAGNFHDGVWAGVRSGSVTATNSQNYIFLNFIGLDYLSGAAIPNGGDGVHLEPGNQGFRIGDPSNDSYGNVISGNSGYGVYIYGGSQGTVSGNYVANNAIGVTATLDQAVPNSRAGVVFIATAARNDILGNVISGNLGAGVELWDADQTYVSQNIIGSSPSGDVISNGNNGISISCTDVSCTSGATVTTNIIANNQGHGVSMWGGVTACAIGPNNDISSNLGEGVLAMLADASNNIEGNHIQGNGDLGIFLIGSSLLVGQNQIIDNVSWGIGVIPYYGSNRSPATAADDTICGSVISGNSIDGNNEGGIILQDTTVPNAANLGNTNVIGDNNGYPDVLEAWFGAAEILDAIGNPITSGNYRVTLTSASVGYSVQGTVPDGGLWGDTGFDYDDVYYWFFLPSFIVDKNGNFFPANPYTVEVVGPTSGRSTYTFDGVNNDVSQGGQPAGINTAGQFRYQVADVITRLDSDQDGIPDEEDCAPYDAAFPLTHACDADGDGYCNDDISGRVRQANCPNDSACQAGLCTPTDCDDGRNQVNPGVSEGPFGSATCGDSLDNDCDNLVDMSDQGCWQCMGNADCNNNNVCDGEESCVNHVCAAGTPLNCNDSNPCTDDSCDATNGCQNVNDDSNTCNDDDPCTMNDRCHDGSCIGDPLDGDSDGYVSDACGGDDCDDGRSAVNPGATEGPFGSATCSDSLDNDCDDATDANDNGCQQNLCGNGALDTGEACDDGNDQPGDGCDAACAVEAGWACRTSVQPSLCGSAAVAGEVVITEIMQDPACVQDTSGEWFEIKNNTSRTLVLKGWRMYDQGTDRHVISAAISLEAGSYAVFCRNADGSVNGGISCAYQYATFQLANADDEILIEDPAATLIDMVAYDGGPNFPDPTGKSMSLDLGHTDAAANDQGANWCEAKDAIVGGCGDLGTPGAANPYCVVCVEDQDGDGHLSPACGGDDCDDNNAEVFPGAAEIECDGLDNDCCESGLVACFFPTPDDPDPTDEDHDSYTIGCGHDCDDTEETVHPGASEVCDDQIDQDCNGSDLQCGCQDADQDGHEDVACGGSDCDDADSQVHPGAAEVICDGQDNDCCESGSIACLIATPDDPEPTDGDEDGHTIGCGQDCDDGDDTIYPGASEICDDDIDQDCNGQDLQCGCQDSDEDGHYDGQCGGDDCDDSRDDVHPGAQEVCDGVDNDCDQPQQIDEGFGQLSCGVGACAVTVNECENGVPQQCVPRQPPETHERTCNDTVDNDCDGLTDVADSDCQGCWDDDGDGYQDKICGGDDCDDADDAVHPGAEEICSDSLDNDCDGKIDFDDADSCARGSSGCGCSTAREGAGSLALALMVLLFRRRR